MTLRLLSGAEQFDTRVCIMGSVLAGSVRPLADSKCEEIALRKLRAKMTSFVEDKLLGARRSTMGTLVLMTS